MINLLNEIEEELVLLGYNDTRMADAPIIILRVKITLFMTYLYLYDSHKLTIHDKKWLEYYSSYVHFFDNDKLEKLGEMYCKLSELVIQNIKK